MTGRPIVVTAMLMALLAAPAVRPADGPTIRVIDAATRQPIAGAIVSAGDVELSVDGAGLCRLPGPATAPIRVRAYGYLRASVATKANAATPVEVALAAFRPKALYLSVYGIGHGQLRAAALALIETTALNAVVIDVKGDRGIIPFRIASPLAERAGAQKVITIRDLQALIAGLHDRGIYAIARIVVFKDPLLASARPDLAVRRLDGSVYRDREHLLWTDPYSRDVWDYNIGVAIEAARAGFDEIQFDYVRLPDASGLALPGQSARDRSVPIDGFLAEARKKLVPFNVFLAADVFGYVCWNTDDTHIGQLLEHMMGIVDYMCPMLYPSSFQFGIPGCRTPVQHPYEIVHRSLDRALERTRVPPVRFRPWLQAFPDYAFGGGAFTGMEIGAQIRAAEEAGTDGWMLWNPKNRYTASGIPPEQPRRDTATP